MSHSLKLEDDNMNVPSTLPRSSFLIQDLRNSFAQSRSSGTISNDSSRSISSTDSTLSIETLATSNTTLSHETKKKENKNIQNEEEQNVLVEPLPLDENVRPNLSASDLALIKETLYHQEADDIAQDNGQQNHKCPFHHTPIVSPSTPISRRRPRDRATIQRRKDRFRMHTRVLMKQLKREDYELYVQAKNTIISCSRNHRRGISGYQSLSKSIQVSLKQLVGSHHWNRSRIIASQLLSKKKYNRPIAWDGLHQKERNVEENLDGYKTFSWMTGQARNFGLGNHGVNAGGTGNERELKQTFSVDENSAGQYPTANELSHENYRIEQFHRNDKYVDFLNTDPNLTAN